MSLRLTPKHEKLVEWRRLCRRKRSTVLGAGEPVPESDPDADAYPAMLPIRGRLWLVAVEHVEQIDCF